MTPAVPSPDFYIDFHGLNELRASARKNSDSALPAAARQFEAIFVQMMLKSMRDAKLADTLFDSDQGEVYQGLIDQQLSLALSQGQGIGLGDLLVRQISGSDGDSRTLAPAVRGLGAAHSPPDLKTILKPNYIEETPSSPREFVRQLWPHARAAAAKLGIVPDVLIAQSALETGWGRGMIRHSDGRNSYNLFGIKAGDNWHGNAVVSPTIEYVDGTASRDMAAFRAYGSYAESFTDYVDFIRSSPRYAAALSQAEDPRAYVEGLHAAGYATDPEYSWKIIRIISSPQFREDVAAVKNQPAAPLS